MMKIVKIVKMEIVKMKRSELDSMFENISFYALLYLSSVFR